MTETVYCLDANALPEPTEDVQPLTPALFHRIATTGSFRERSAVETDEAYRQIIPYAVVLRDERVFRVRRLRAGSEARLHDRLSIGIGGHINPPDAERTGDPVQGALVRELREELELGAFRAEAVGLIHRDDGAVSRVHTGVLYRVSTHHDVRVRETTKLDGTFVTPDELEREYAGLEGWSQAAARFLGFVPAARR